MSLHPTRQMPITLRTQSKTDVRTQFSALCYRFSKDKPEILLITSRRTGRWILPKGWPIDGQTPGQTALTEAWEEAGVIGKASEQCIGLFSYSKTTDPEGSLPCLGLVFPVKVKSLAKDFPEAGQRRRQWFRPKKAATRVSEPELAQILRHFDPKRLLR
ncbi:MAG: NUDIX hydrolase [Roseovarius sp.]|nr:NUDIX hydrolase [Roseovarius sp.]